MPLLACLLALSALLFTASTHLTADVTAGIAFSTPSFTPETVPLLQWSHTLATSDFATASTAAGNGLFFVSGRETVRVRAVDGSVAWSDALDWLPNDSTCGEPFLPPDNPTHLYVLCTPNIIVKRWYDTHALQFAVQVFANGSVPIGPQARPSLNKTAHLGAALNLTQIIGLSSEYDPPALLLGSSFESSLVAIDSRDGAFVRAFVTSPMPSFHHPPTDLPFVSFASLRGYFLNLQNTTSLFVVAHAINTIGTKSLIGFKISTATFALYAQHEYRTLISDAHLYPAHTITVNTDAHQFCLRTENDFIVITPILESMFYQVDANFLPLETRVRTVRRDDGRFLLPSRFTLAQARDPVSGRILLNGVDIIKPTYVQLDLTDVLDLPPALTTAAQEREYHVLLDAADRLVLLDATSIRVIAFNFSTSPSTMVGSVNLLWAFQYYEDGPDRVPNTTSIHAFATQLASPSTAPDTRRIHSIEFLADMTSAQPMILVQTTSTAGPIDPFWPSAFFVFATQPSPTCSEVAANVIATTHATDACMACDAVTGTRTARSCAYCATSGECTAFVAYRHAAPGETCADDTNFATGVDVCAQPVTPSSDGAPVWPVVLLVVGLSTLLVGLLAFLIARDRRRARQLATSHRDALKQEYARIEASPSFMDESLEASPSALGLQGSTLLSPHRVTR